MTAPGSVSDRMILVDAHALVYQSFHAIRDGITAPDGRSTNAVFGFTRELIRLHEERRPDFLICAFDLPGPTFRSDIASEYKAHRPPPPDDLALQVPLIQQVVTAMNVPVVTHPGFEADDVMATIAVAAAARGMDVAICTSDKDCRQLISDRIHLVNLRKGAILDRDALWKDWGITPEQVVDFQTLVGDSVDNVTGVPGVGEKTAAKLLQKYGTIDNLLQHVDEVTGPKMREAIKEAARSGQLEQTRKLVRLETAVPLEFDWEGWKRREWDNERLLALFQELGFRQFAERVRTKLKTAGASKNAAMLATVGEAGLATSLFDAISDDAEDGAETVEVPPGLDFEYEANAAESSDGWNGKYTLIDTPKAFAEFLKKLKKQPRFAFDLETTGLDPLRSAIVGLAFCWQATTGYYLPVRGPEGEPRLDEAETLAALKPVFENPAIAKVNQNIKFDVLALRQAGITVRGISGDPMLAHYLLHAGERSHGLDEMTRTYFHHENISITDLIGKRGKNQLTIDQVSTSRVAEYAGEDADAAWRLTEKLEADLVQAGLRGLYETLEVPLIEVLVELEATGIRLDVPFLRKLGDEMGGQLEVIEAKIHALAGRKFNIASPKQLRTVLFDELKLPTQKKTDLTGEASTDQETLEKLAALGHELPKKIIEYRQISKLKGTYVDALPELVNPATGRLHTSFNQTVAATGRLSSSDPNLQNIPARTDQGKQVRQAFLPKDGWLLLTADYSQVELRLLAHFCGDAALQQAFAEDKDVHALVAAEIFRVPEAAVTSTQRRVAKTVNFGVIYGISPHGLAVRLGISRDEAAKFIDAYFARYPKVLEYQANLLSRCRKTGHVETLLGRRRKFAASNIRPTTNFLSRNQVEREAINMEIQGSAADLMKKAMLTIHRRLKTEKLKARMLLTVHDELVFEVPPMEVEAVARLAREEMTGALTLKVPLMVDVAAGKNWLEVEAVAN